MRAVERIKKINIKKLIISTLGIVLSWIGVTIGYMFFMQYIIVATKFGTDTMKSVKSVSYVDNMKVFRDISNMTWMWLLLALLSVLLIIILTVFYQDFISFHFIKKHKNLWIKQDHKIMNKFIVIMEMILIVPSAGMFIIGWALSWILFSVSGFMMMASSKNIRYYFFKFMNTFIFKMFANFALFPLIMGILMTLISMIIVFYVVRINRGEVHKVVYGKC